MRLTDLIAQQDKRHAQVLDDILDAFGDHHLRPEPNKTLVRAYIVRAHYRRRVKHPLRLVRKAS